MMSHQRLPDRPSTPAQSVLAPEEREAVVARLSTAFADDVLQIEEFERRIAAVYSATSRAELSGLTTDLLNATSADVAEYVPRALLSPRIAAVFANVERGGLLEVPARIEIRTVFGNVELDLRTARFGPGLTEISVDSVFGNVEILLAPDIAAENHAEGFLASFQCRAASLPSSGASRATVRITGHAILSNVEVKSSEAPPASRLA